jgi:hypothetical protein
MAAEARDLAPTDSRKKTTILYLPAPTRLALSSQNKHLGFQSGFCYRYALLPPRGGQPHWRAEALAAETPGRESEFVDDLLRREETVEW